MSRPTAACFIDDTGDPAQTLDSYEDGDHLSRDGRRRYTDIVRRPPATALSVIFHSLDFVAFFVVVVAVYWRLPHRGQNVLLLVASYFFYGYVHPWFLLLIATSTVDRLLRRARDGAVAGAQARSFLGSSIISNFGMLGFFKYFNFFVDNVARGAGRAGRHASVSRRCASCCRSASRSTRSRR